MTSNILGATENVESVIKKIINFKEHECGTISIDVPNWVKIQDNVLNVNKDYPDDSIGQITLTIKCNAEDITFSNDTTLFNEQTKQWVLNPAQWNWLTNKLEQEDVKNSFKLYQLKNENSYGWIVTQIGIGSNEDDYTKSLSFCLISDDHLKQLCGYGLIQYIPHREDLGTTVGDFEPVVTKLIGSIKFISENKLAPCDKK